ncbi:hypothetical protein FHU38_001082 [Saccharomonospora amisosensis]|uniref:Uncharacterized protein n=1 Tax=Saccharomonospora amisosensis TaxID=1128677 RepID=A0A7X5UNA5_9PSEU|nr:hypothetical protein [Saccharomonospora amisosensis]NIJ10738.1 hypothetical protein [Saccharomonospora amisosensis]
MRERTVDRLLIAVLAVDAALLAVLELFYLPLRLDGLLLPRLQDAPVPVSAVVAAVTTPLLVVVAAKLTSRRTATVPLLVWLLTLLVLGVLGPGGDVVLLADWRTLLLLAAGALPGALALGGALAPATGRSR